MTERAEEGAGYPTTTGDHAQVMRRSLVIETGVSIFPTAFRKLEE